MTRPKRRQSPAFAEAVPQAVAASSTAGAGA
jgi:hypothetical protein